MLDYWIPLLLLVTFWLRVTTNWRRVSEAVFECWLALVRAVDIKVFCSPRDKRLFGGRIFSVLGRKYKYWIAKYICVRSRGNSPKKKQSTEFSRRLRMTNVSPPHKSNNFSNCLNFNQTNKLHDNNKDYALWGIADVGFNFPCIVILICKKLSNKQICIPIKM